MRTAIVVLVVIFCSLGALYFSSFSITVTTSSSSYQIKKHKEEEDKNKVQTPTSSSLKSMRTTTTTIQQHSSQIIISNEEVTTTTTSAPSSSSSQQQQRQEKYSPSIDSNEKYIGNSWRHKSSKPKFNFPQPVGSIKSVLIDVGTNTKPDFADWARSDGGIFYIGVDPLQWREAEKNACVGMQHRCTFLPAVVYNSGAQHIKFNLGHLGVCSSILSGGRSDSCAASSKVVYVPVTTIDEIIDRIPGDKDLPISLIAIDAQGTDLAVASTLKRHRDRVANIIVECQDFPLGHPKLIYRDHRAKTCGHVISCLTERWGFKLNQCTINYKKIREVNCAFHNPRHSMRNETLTHPQDTGKVMIIEFPQKCDWKFAHRQVGSSSSQQSRKMHADGPFMTKKKK